MQRNSSFYSISDDSSDDDKMFGDPATVSSLPADSHTDKYSFNDYKSSSEEENHFDIRTASAETLAALPKKKLFELLEKNADSLSKTEAITLYQTALDPTTTPGQRFWKQGPVNETSFARADSTVSLIRDKLRTLINLHSEESSSHQFRTDSEARAILDNACFLRGMSFERQGNLKTAIADYIQQEKLNGDKHKYPPNYDALRDILKKASADTLGKLHKNEIYQMLVDVTNNLQPADAVALCEHALDDKTTLGKRIYKQAISRWFNGKPESDSGTVKNIETLRDAKRGLVLTRN